MRPTHSFIDDIPRHEYFELVDALEKLVERGDPDRLLDLFFIQFALGNSEICLGPLSFERDDAHRALQEIGIFKLDFSPEDDQVDRCLRSFPKIFSDEFRVVFEELCVCLERLEGFRGLSFAHSVRIFLFFAPRLGIIAPRFLAQLEYRLLVIAGPSESHFKDLSLALQYRLALSRVSAGPFNN